MYICELELDELLVIIEDDVLYVIIEELEELLLYVMIEELWLDELDELLLFVITDELELEMEELEELSLILSALFNFISKFDHGRFQVWPCKI